MALRTRPFREPALSGNLDLVEKLRDISARLGIPIGQIAIAWALLRPEITSVIVGARRPSQIVETGPGGDLILNQVDLNEILKLLSAL